MSKFCKYGNVKPQKPEKPNNWRITSVEVLPSYDFILIQADSDAYTSEHRLDLVELLAKNYKDGLDPYSSTVVNDLVGVTDWVLDPANNSINYTTEEEVYIGTWGIGSGSTYTTGEAAAAAKCSEKGQIYRGVDKKRQPPLALCITETGYKDQWSITFDGTTVIEQEPKSLPLDVVAQKVISNAQGGDAAAQDVISNFFLIISDSIMISDYSDYFELNKKPK